MKIQDIKLKEIYFEEVMNDIRNFVIVESYVKYSVGNALIITEVCPIKNKNPRKCMKKISYVMIGDGHGLSKNYCILSLEPTSLKNDMDHSWKSTIPEYDQLRIIEYWKTEKNNNINDLVAKFLYKKSAINNVLDNYLKPKPNGSKIGNSGTD